MIGRSRPLFFFGVPGFLLLLSGVLLGAWVVDIYHKTNILAIGYGLACVLLTVMGGIGLSTGVILHSMRAWLMDWIRPLSSELCQVHAQNGEASLV